jgi:hypothetical protein
VIEIPQSGERIVGVQDRLAVYEAMPLLPTITPRRLLSRDDVVVAEAAMDYDGAVYHVALIFELEDGRIKRETGYWANPLEAPEWRSKWVERIA